MSDLVVSAAVPALEADPFDLSNILDPYDFHERLRETGAVTYIDKYDTYAVGRFAEVREVLSDWESFTSTAGAGLSDIRKPGGWREPGPLVEADPPLHTVRRSVVSKIISPKIIKSWQKTYAEGAADLVDRLCEQREVDGARDPGLVPFADQPQIERSDYVFNANNSYWLANPAEPLTGYSPLHGGEGAVPGGRPRMNDITISEGAGDDGTYTGDEVRDALLSSRSISGEQWADAVAERCTTSGRAEIADACPILASWDHTYSVDSVGAVLGRALLDGLTETP